MKLEDIPFETLDWTRIPPTNHPGETGHATWQTREVGNVRVRIVRYSAGYLADHWCERGHVIHVLDGELTTELRDGRTFVVAAGQSYLVADGDGAHRSRTRADGGATLLIVD
jgi:quercetin dioxygenase-like cupin family protein